MKLFSNLYKIWNKLISRKKRKVVFKPPFGYDYTFKILLVGLPGVGKRNLTQRYCYNVFDPLDKLTIGVDFHVKTVEIYGKKIKLQIWDVAGEERFRFLLPTYTLGANAAMIIFDITKFKTIDQMYNWIQIIREKAGDIPIMLIGNKLDLVENEKDIDRKKYHEFVRKEGLLGYIETSIKDIDSIKKEVPNIIQSTLKKSYQVKFLVNSKELEDIKRFAKLFHQKQSEFIRTAIWEKIRSMDSLSMTKSLKKEKIEEKGLRLDELKRIRELLESLER